MDDQVENANAEAVDGDKEAMAKLNEVMDTMVTEDNEERVLEELRILEAEMGNRNMEAEIKSDPTEE